MHPIIYAYSNKNNKVMVVDMQLQGQRSKRVRHPFLQQR